MKRFIPMDARVKPAHDESRRTALGRGWPAAELTPHCGIVKLVWKGRKPPAMTDLDQKPRPAETSFRSIGQPVVRKEDERLTTGRGRFSDDFSVDGQAYAVMLRSPHAHARILGIDARRAKAMPRVLGVFTGADCLADGLAAIPHDPLPKTKYDMKLEAAGGGALFIGPHLLLPADKARHVGEAVAMVVAETVAQALDAAECVDVDNVVCHLVRRSRGNGQSVRARRSRRGHGLPHRSRHRRAA